MQGYYAPSLVLLSYLVAILASYSALYFGAQLASRRARGARLWLALGAITMGTGIWSMHFVGMRAYITPIAMSYDLGLTILSWLAAIASSALALYMISLGRIRRWHIAASSLAMGGGIGLMHYVGMAAMKMSPSISYDPVFFTLSLLIAIGASLAAMIICRTLSTATGTRALLLQITASLVMGAAICGMHYTGMLAVIYPPNAVPAADNLLAGDWLGAPLAITISALIVLALVVAMADAKKRRRAEALAEAEEERLNELAFTDPATGLPNRSALDRHLLQLIIENKQRELPFGVIYLELANVGSPNETLNAAEQARLAAGLNALISDETFLGRYAPDAFMLIVSDHKAVRHQAMYEQLRQLPDVLDPADMALQWRAGQSAFPTTGRSSRMLIRVAMKTGSLQQIGEFGALKSVIEDPLAAPLAAS